MAVQNIDAHGLKIQSKFENLPGGVLFHTPPPPFPPLPVCKIWQINQRKVDSMYYRFKILSSELRPPIESYYHQMSQA